MIITVWASNMIVWLFPASPVISLRRPRVEVLRPVSHRQTRPLATLIQIPRLPRYLATYLSLYLDEVGR
jgi:hypothetical protein